MSKQEQLVGHIRIVCGWHEHPVVHRPLAFFKPVGVVEKADFFAFEHSILAAQISSWVYLTDFLLIMCNSDIPSLCSGALAEGT